MILRALFWLTASLVIRLLREGMVLRSMTFPALVTVGTLAATLSIVSWNAPGRTVLVTPDAPAEVSRALEERDYVVREDPRALERARAGEATFATDGRRLVVYGTPPAALDIEAVLRRGGSWSPEPWRPQAPTADGPGPGADLVGRVIGLLFALYGLVFGLGGVARDRDAGVLETELALPVPFWVGGLARWLASSLVLCGFFAATVLLVGSLLPFRHPEDILAHGWAASCGAVAIGLGVVGTSGLKNGFSGAFALGMTIATALGGAGASLGLHFLPVGSLLSDRPGWVALAVSLGFGGVASAAYGRRGGAGR